MARVPSKPNPPLPCPMCPSRRNRPRRTAPHGRPKELPDAPPYFCASGLRWRGARGSGRGLGRLLLLPAQGDVRSWLVSAAVLATHSHNLQSWVVDLREPGHLDLYCDRQRLLPETDPLNRQIMMSHGTFLELLDMAAREAGLRAEVALFPQGVFAGEVPDHR